VQSDKKQSDEPMVNFDMNLFFGKREDWSTWTGVEVGRRILNFLNAKIEGTNGVISPHLSRNKSISSTTDLRSLHQQRHESREYGEIISSPLDEELSGNMPLPSSRISLTIDTSTFFSYSEPPISLGDYIDRLIKYTKNSISPVNLGVALLYVDRIEGHVEVNRFSIFRLFAIAYLIAHKYMDDSPSMKNLEYSKIAGLTLQELNNLEMTFLKAIDFQLGMVLFYFYYLCCFFQLNYFIFIITFCLIFLSYVLNFILANPYFIIS
jgi:hypothetical protein